MTILAVLENELAIPAINEIISTLQPEAELFCFGSALPALAAARKNEIDIALIDVKLPELNGIDFGQYLQELYPLVNLIYLSNLRQDLQNTFTKLKLNGIILKQRGSLAVAMDKIECDLYDWLEKKQESRYHYLGDYMNQYSWPEVMHAELDEISWSFEDE